MALRQLADVAKRTHLDDDLHAVLAHPRRVLSVSIPTKMDDGSVRVFEGFRVQHNLTRGPGKGGIRYHPGVTLDEVKALAMWMTWKMRRRRHPVRRSKGGVICDPKKMSLGELERMTRRYTSEILPIIGPERDIPAPDVNTNAQTMAWLMDTYSMNLGYSVPGVTTGKPLSIGGSLGRNEATARGCLFVIQAASKRYGIPLNNPTAVVQGFGNAGAIAARLLNEAGFTILAVNDSRGGIINPKGLDPVAVLKHKEKTGSVVGFPGSAKIGTEELLTTQVRRARPRRARKPDHRAHREEGQGAAHRRSRQRPDDARRRRHPRIARHRRPARHPGQRRRRHRQLLRVGAEPPVLFLERARGQPRTARRDAARLSRRPEARRPGEVLAAPGRALAGRLARGRGDADSRNLSGEIQPEFSALSLQRSSLR